MALQLPISAADSRVGAAFPAAYARIIFGRTFAENIVITVNFYADEQARRDNPNADLTAPDGYSLAQHLRRYSERGMDYVREVRSLMRVNGLRALDRAKLDTALIPREAAQLFGQEPLGSALAMAAVVAHVVQAEQALAGDDPFSARDGWCSHGLVQRRFEFEFAGERLHAELSYGRDGLRLALDGQPAQDLRVQWRGSELVLHLGGRSERTRLYWQGEVAHVFSPRGATRITLIDALAQAGGTDASQLPAALASVAGWVRERTGG
jgi:hypothetical protein